MPSVTPSKNWGSETLDCKVQSQVRTRDKNFRPPSAAKVNQRLHLLASSFIPEVHLEAEGEYIVKLEVDKMTKRKRQKLGN